MQLPHFLNSNQRTANASKQILYSFSFQSISILISLLYVPFLLNYLNPEKYGIWLTLTSILGWFSFFDVGLGNGLRNKLGSAFAIGDFKLGRKYVSTTYAIVTLIFSSLLILFHVGNSYINWNSILNTKTISSNELYVLTSIVFSFFLIRFIFQLISVVYLANQKSAIDNFINAMSSILSFIMVLILINSNVKGDLVILGSIISGIPVLIFIVITFISYNGRYKLVRPSVSEIDLKLSNGLMNLGAKFFFLQICSIIIFSTSSFFISQFYGPKEVVLYNIVFKYFQIAVMVFSILLSPVWSAVTDAYSKSDTIWLKKTLKQLNLLSLIFTIFVIIMVLISKWIFRLWLNDTINVPSDLPIFMAAYTIMQIWIAPYSSFINGLGKIKLTLSLTFVGISLYLILIFSFSHIFKNSVGIIASIIITNLIGAIIQPIQTYRILSGKAKGIWDQ